MVQGNRFSQRNLLISSSLKVNFLCLSIQNSSPFETVFEYGFFFKYLYTTTCFRFLGAVEQLRKVTIRVFMSLSPRGKTRLPLDGYSRNFIFEAFSKICREDSKYGKNEGNFRVDCVCVCICTYISLHSF